MTQQLQVFQNEEFGKVRVLEIDGQPWFVGKDVAEALGYEKPRNALVKHVDEDDALKQGVIDAVGREQQTTVINESGLYSLILSSKLPTAKKFKRWVTSEILPSIRKHGAYLTDETLRQVLRSPEFAVQLFQELQSEKEKTAALEEYLEEAAPKAHYCDTVLTCSNALPVSIIAKDYSMTAIAFNRLLNDLGIQYRLGSTWLLYKEWDGKGYTHSRTYHINDKTAVVHTYWTQKGRMFLYDRLAWFGILPISESAWDDEEFEYEEELV